MNSAIIYPTQGVSIHDCTCSYVASPQLSSISTSGQHFIFFQKPSEKFFSPNQIPMFNNKQQTSNVRIDDRQITQIISSSSSHLSHRHKFSPEEDENLRKLIEINGPKKWDHIALSMPGRTGRQCRDRYHNYLDPVLTNGPWTSDEDNILEEKVN